MIREIKKYKIKKIHPNIFWTRCHICNREFKKEDGWEIKYKSFSNYLCIHCAPNKEIAKQYAESETKCMLPIRHYVHRDNSDLDEIFKQKHKGVTKKEIDKALENI